MKKKTKTKKKSNKNILPKIIKPDHISYSQIASGRCLYHYFQTRLTNNFKVEGEHLSAGHCAHKIIYEYTKELHRVNTDRDFELMQELVNKYFGEYGLSETQYIDMRKALLEFGERGIDVEKLLGFELESDIKLNGGGRFKAIIDRVNSYSSKSHGSCLEIIDYKNHLNILTKSEVENSEQLMIYRWIVCKKLYPNFDSVRVGIHHIKYNYCVYSDWKKIPELEKDFENMESYLNRQWDRLIMSEIYPAKRCQLCYEYGGCQILFAGQCPLFTEDERRRVIKSNDPKELVRLYRQADSIVFNVKEALKNHVSKLGPILVDDRWYGYVPTETYKYDIEQAIEFCHKYQIPLGEIKSFNKTDFEKTVKTILGRIKNAEYEDDLNSIKKYEQHTTFKVR